MGSFSSQLPPLPILSQQVIGCCCHSDSKWGKKICSLQNESNIDNDYVKIIGLTLTSLHQCKSNSVSMKVVKLCCSKISQNKITVRFKNEKIGRSRSRPRKSMCNKEIGFTKAMDAKWYLELEVQIQTHILQLVTFSSVGLLEVVDLDTCGWAASPVQHPVWELCSVVWSTNFFRRKKYK